jgi:hypothetical protein
MAREDMTGINAIRGESRATRRMLPAAAVAHSSVGMATIRSGQFARKRRSVPSRNRPQQIGKFKSFVSTDIKT